MMKLSMLPLVLWLCIEPPSIAFSFSPLREFKTTSLLRKESPKSILPVDHYRYNNPQSGPNIKIGIVSNTRIDTRIHSGSNENTITLFSHNPSSDDPSTERIFTPSLILKAIAFFTAHRAGVLLIRSLTFIMKRWWDILLTFFGYLR